MATRAHQIRRAVEAAAHFPPLPHDKPPIIVGRRARARREFWVLSLRARGFTLKEIGQMGHLWPTGKVTRERIRLHEANGLRRVREWIGGPLPCEIPDESDGPGG